MASRIRHPTPQEVEKLRLLLSTYQDGTGQLVRPGGTSLPGFRDFERAVALALGGEAQESKFVFDVLVDVLGRPGVKYGLACKMKGELNKIDREGRAYLELSNAAGEFWAYLKTKGIDQNNYRDRPKEVGIALVNTVRKWHVAARTARAGKIDLGRSSYLVLSWNKAGWYQLHQFSLRLPNPESLNWNIPMRKIRDTESPAKRIQGDDISGRLFDWYGESGGQLKYYPMVKDALWLSERFRLEPLGDPEHGVLLKVAAYFPEPWERVNRAS